MNIISRKTFAIAGAVLAAGLLIATDAHAAAGNDVSKIAQNITTSIQSVPFLITAISYLLGILLVVLGIMKIKDHVENPSQTPIKDGAIRLLVGGALFAIPIVSEAFLNTIGADQTGVATAKVKKIEFGGVQ